MNSLNNRLLSNRTPPWNLPDSWVQFLHLPSHRPTTSHSGRSLHIGQQSYIADIITFSCRKDTKQNWINSL